MLLLLSCHSSNSTWSCTLSSLPWLPGQVLSILSLLATRLTTWSGTLSFHYLIRYSFAWKPDQAISPLLPDQVISPILPHQVISPILQCVLGSTNIMRHTITPLYDEITKIQLFLSTHHVCGFILVYVTYWFDAYTLDNKAQQIDLCFKHIWVKILSNLQNSCWTVEQFLGGSWWRCLGPKASSSGTCASKWALT